MANKKRNAHWITSAEWPSVVSSNLFKTRAYNNCLKNLNIKGTSLMSKNLKTQNLNFLHRSAWALNSDSYAKDNEEIYLEINRKLYM
jgi:hypothetical protein